MSLDLTETRDPQDIDLLATVRIALGLRQRFTFRAIRIDVTDRVVTLQGTVPSFYDRQLAFETVRRVARVKEIRDQIQVIDKREGEWPSPTLRIGSSGSSNSSAHRSKVARADSTNALGRWLLGSTALLLAVVSGSKMTSDRLAIHAGTVASASGEITQNSQ
jgi:hypothetical protein